MRLLDAEKERMMVVEILGVPGLFTVGHVNRAAVPKGMYVYDMQTSEDDWNCPCLIARHITMNHFGTVITASPIELPGNGCRDLAPGGFAMGDRPGYLTIAEFERKYPPYNPQPPKSNRKAPFPAR